MNKDIDESQIKVFLISYFWEMAKTETGAVSLISDSDSEVNIADPILACVEKIGKMLSTHTLYTDHFFLSTFFSVFSSFEAFLRNFNNLF